MLELTVKQMRRCDLITANGRIDSASVADLKKALDSITDARRFKIVLDLADVTFMSSAGLRQLLDTQKTCKQLKQGEVVLANLSDNLRDVLELAGLDVLFTVFDNTVDAVGHF